SNQYRLFVSEDGGLRFRPVERPDGLAAPITGLATHPTDPATAYALFSIPASGNPTIKSPKVLRTTDLGATWEDLTGTFTDGETLSSTGFPDVAIYDLLVMPFDTDLLWVGTEIGLFVSEDGGQTWQRAETGLPAAAIWQLSIVDDQVVAATHGRGVWSVTLPELEDYAPPVVTRAPRLNAASSSAGGTVSLDVSLRSPYDSVGVAVDSTVVSTGSGATAVTDTTIAATLSVDEVREIEVAAVAYRDGRTFRSPSETLTVYPPVAVQPGYASDFDDLNGDDFIQDGFEIRRGVIGAFLNGVATTESPYPNGGSLVFQLRVPILVAEAEADAVLTYRDIALVQPGDFTEDDVFGNPEFRDYVVVEGSTDGSTWTPLADGYDTRFTDDWRQAFNGQIDLSEDLFVEHTINLHDTFAPGDVVFVRFRLFADDEGNGPGWIIDDLAVQPNAPVSSEAPGDVPQAFALGQNYPNPFNPSTTIPFTLQQAADVTVAIYDLRGRRVATLAEGAYPAGTHEVAFDASNLASGVYLYRLEAGAQRLHKTMTLVK
ncbi:MAG: T9SS type A sorting domain-containing protein, partial [Bacteroidetes bacterium]|nr:T9SS type A sorting domain-containing protein [Bacteroidota bacterium]